MPELADQAPHIFLKKRIHSDRFSNLEDTHAAALELLRIGKSVDHLEGRTPLKEVITQPWREKDEVVEADRDMNLPSRVLTIRATEPLPNSPVLDGSRVRLGSRTNAINNI